MATILGTSNSETIDALDGVTNFSDTIYGFAGNDIIFGLGGNDLIIGGAGADEIYGGKGRDTASYTDSAEGVFASLFNNVGLHGTAQGDTFASIENLTGSAHDDILVGSDGSNLLAGLEDDDSLKGGGGADQLEGGSGNDLLHGGSGADALIGGSGIDTSSYAGSEFGVVVNLGNGMVAGGDGSGDTIFQVENIIGSSRADSLFGDGLANVLIGDAGNDFLFGGLNNDVFAFNLGFGHDTILDFTVGSDKIQVNVAVFPDYITFLMSGAQVGDDVVFVDDADNTITLENVQLSTISESDFIFV
jgi:serralysin